MPSKYKMMTQMMTQMTQMMTQMTQMMTQLQEDQAGMSLMLKQNQGSHSRERSFEKKIILPMMEIFVENEK